MTGPVPFFSGTILHTPQRILATPERSGERRGISGVSSFEMYAGYNQVEWDEIKRRNSIRHRGTTCDVQLLEQPFDVLDWPTVRVLHVLQSREVKTVRDVCLLSEADLLKTRRCGRKTLNLIKDVLAEHGLQLFTEYNQMGPDHYWGA